MDIDLAEIEQSLVMVYQKNLQFLKENFFDIFEEVDQFSKDLEDGKIKEKYSLEMKDGYFDIQNLKNSGYFYATNSYQDAEKRAENTTLDTNNSINLLRENPNTGKLISGSLLKDVAPIIDYLNENVDFKNIEFEKVFKRIYIGTGLGFHIQEIDKNTSSYTTLIIEEELEVFRLSLFTTDYSVFNTNNRKLFLSIGNDKKDRKKALQLFSNYHNYMNYNIQYTTLLANSDEIKEEIIQFFHELNILGFPYKATLENLEKMIGFIKNEDRFLNRFYMEDKKILKDKKILLISAGPSVDGYIDWIKEHQDKFIVCSVDIIVKKLEVNGIVPDIVFSIDPHEIISKFLDTKDKNFLDDSLFVLLSQQSKNAMEILENKSYYFAQVLPLVKELGYLGSVPNVGTFSFLMAAAFGANELYLIGNDAAFNQETGSRYAQDSGADASINILKDKHEEDSSSKDEKINDNDILKVKGNLRDIVKTNRELYRFKSSYDDVIHALKSLKFVAYNLSDGVYIEGLVPCTQEELNNKVKDNQKLDKSNLKKYFDSVSQVVESLTVDDDIKIINSIITKVKKFQKHKVTSKDNFYEHKLDLMIWILEKVKKMDYEIYGNFFLQYTELVDVYVNFILNLKQKDLHSKDKLNQISIMWAKGVIELFRDIKKILK